MDTNETFQISVEAAEAYESQFVPAIFAEWAPRILDAAGVSPGDRVLDVACGTGVVARLALERVGPSGKVVGVDLNDAMLAVAARIEPRVEWRQGDAAALPVPDRAFDSVTCQMAMMFFPDRRAAFAEMERAAQRDGTVAVVVPAALDAQPAYQVFVEAAVDRVGESARSLLATYWNCGDLDALAAEAAGEGLATIERTTIPGTARFGSAQDFVMTEIHASPLSDRVNGDDAHAISDVVSDRLARYATPDGFEIPLICHLLVLRPAGPGPVPDR
jgi:SAM-dependent methyltransferase